MDSTPQLHSQTAPAPSRSRSTTAMSNKPRKRPESRASTTSVQSAATQPMEQQFTEQHPVEFQKQWYDNGNNMQQMPQRFPGMEHQMTDHMMIHSGSQVQHGRDFGIDPALGAAVSHNLGYAPHDGFKASTQRHSLPGDGYGTSFAEDDSPIIEGRSDEQDEVDSVAGAVGAPKKVSKSSAANEMEMRSLFANNKHRTLPEVARELHGNERGPQSERTRQVFAMLWINQVCDKGKGSVPRGRVYANYVSRCATEHVTVLNPASFGKLVRVLFPGLKTRRLGVRGESKYHYVNFSLREDQPEINEMRVQPPPQPFQEPVRFAPEPSMQHAQMPVDRAVFPSLNTQQVAERPPRPRNNNNTSINHSNTLHSRSLYNVPIIHNMHDLDTASGKMIQKLRFAAPGDATNHQYDSIQLPKIEPYLPAGTDRDSATALTALYRSHCISLVDAIRYVKQKTFFHLFTSFHGTLTMPVQKLFANLAIAPWIEECDFIMYQKMLSVVDHLTLEVVPQAILDTLHQISERLVPHIKNSFLGHPTHVIQAKVAPATLFAGLLDRMCRVNLTAHAAANMLSHPPNRDQMYEDWITMVRLRKVAENVPTRAMDDVVRLLLTELRNLLDPVNVQWEVESLTVYGEVSSQNDHQQQRDIHTDASTENVLDRWVNFLMSIPGRFPYASPAEIVWCIERVGNAVMRDLTIRSGQSFGAWWVTKCWIDEMISFMAEKGGFMDYKPAHPKASEIPSAQNRMSSFSQQISHSHSHFNGNGNGNDDYSGMSMNGGLNDGTHVMSGPMASTSQAAMNSAAGHDDSGIGMRTPDEEFSLSKFGFTNGQMPHTNLV